MKTLRNIFLMLVLVPVVFSSCKKDDEDDKKNAFTIGETEYAIDNGAAVYYGVTVEDGDYNFDIYLFTEEIDYYAETGTGNRIYFELFSETYEDIKSGTYTYDASRSGKAGTFGEGDKSMVALNYDVLLDTGTLYQVTDGSLTINVSSLTYTIDFNLSLNDGTTVEGHYKGELAKIDF